MNFRAKLFSVVLLLGILGGMIGSCSGLSQKQPAVIAVAVPLSGADSLEGQQIKTGIELAVEQFNQRIRSQEAGRQLKVMAFDSTDGSAQVLAEKVVASEAVAVIGAFSGESAAQVAEIYTAAKIPVLNVASASEALPKGHPYYFQVAFPVETQAAYLANYLRKYQHRGTASIIATGDLYSQALARKFNHTFTGLGGKIVFSQAMNENLEDVDSAIEQVVNQLISLNVQGTDPGVIFIAADERWAVPLLIKIRHKGLTSVVVGADNLSGPYFSRQIAAQSEELSQPGYFTDGILTTRAVLFDSANRYASRFLTDYLAVSNGQEPGDAAAYGYNAVLLLAEAIRQADFVGAPDRSRVYEALLTMKDAQTGVGGLTGPLYFGIDRIAVAAVQMGEYQLGELISAMTQFRPVQKVELLRDLSAQLASGRIITLDGDYAYVTNVVYTGIDLLEISDINILDSTYKMDFYLWFRYRPTVTDPDFKPEDFVFANLADQDKNWELIREEEFGGNGEAMVIKTYRVTQTFKAQFDFHAYPFDRQNLVIKLRNQNATSSLIQYVVDRSGMHYASDEELYKHFESNGAFGALYGWQAEAPRASQDVFSTSSTMGLPANFGKNNSIDYSLFNFDLGIRRASLDYVFKNLLPLLITLVLAYITFYLPLGHSERMAVGSTALLTTAFFHLNLATSLPEIGYIVAMEYLFYASYLISALIVLLETISIRLEKLGEDEADNIQKEKYKKTREKLNITGRIIYPIILGAVLLGAMLVYLDVWKLNVPVETQPVQAAELIALRTGSSLGIASSSPAMVSKGQVVLRLATWRPEDVQQLQLVLDAFHEYALEQKGRDIIIQQEPVMGVSYDAILNGQLNKGIGPDLFYVRPNQIDSGMAIHLQPLTSLQIESSYDLTQSAPWKSEDGQFYALPFTGVVQGVYYNQDIFEKLALPVPTTWGEFLDTARKLKAGGYIPVANGLNPDEDSEMFQSVLANFVGGSEGRAFFSSINAPLCFDNRRISSAFQAIVDLRPYLPPDVATIRSSASKQLFIDGKAAMLFGGSWDVVYFERELAGKFRWSVFPVPASQGQPVVIFQPDVGIGINSTTAARSDAHLFLEWLMSEEAVELVARNMPGFYPLHDMKGLQPSTDSADSLFLQLSTAYPTDVRWAYTEISSKKPAADALIRAALHEIAARRLSAHDAAARLQAGLAEWYEPAQSCRR